MAKSRFEYVRQFEQPDQCLKNCWIIVRIDGKKFHKFSDTHKFVKPNDERGLALMSRAAEQVMADNKDIILSYGQSDEYSFVFKKNTDSYHRRASKLSTNIVSLFASAYVYHWSAFFTDVSLEYPPAFDARAVLHPSDQNLHDYLSWRQADCHINNLYNTVLWKLVQDGGLSSREATERLKGTLSGDKNEILFSQFGINYNSEPGMYRKGTVIFYKRLDKTSVPDHSSGADNQVSVDSIQMEQETEQSESSRLAEAVGESDQTNGSSDVTNINDDKVVCSSRKPKRRKDDERQKYSVRRVQMHCDIIGKQFWEEYPYILETK